MATKKLPFAIEHKTTAPMTIRLNDDDKDLLRRLKEKLGARSESELIRHAIRWLAKESGLK